MPWTERDAVPVRWFAILAAFLLPAALTALPLLPVASERVSLALGLGPLLALPL